MWSPTHVQVLVKKARGLKIKGKEGTNDCFVTIGLGKEKYQTSVKEKATESVEWCEQCELTIPTQGNTAEIVLTALHRNFVGVDEFLGTVAIPLRDFDVYDRPKTKWYPLKCKPGQSKTDYRGELEVRTAFTVKAVTAANNPATSTADLSGAKGKHKGSLQSLNKAAANFGGSLLSIGQKEKKHLKKIAKSVTHKVEKVGEKAKKSLSKVNLNEGHLPSKLSIPSGKVPVVENERYDNSINRFSDPISKIKGSSSGLRGSGRRLKNQDPGVNSDDEDGDVGRLDDDDMFRFDALSHRSSGSSLNVAKGDNMGTVTSTSTPFSGSFENLGGGELLRKTGASGTPVMRKSFVPQESPLVSGGKKSGGNSGGQADESMDEWELKLIGRKGVPFVSPSKKNQHQQESADAAAAVAFTVNTANNLPGTRSSSSTLERRVQPPSDLRSLVIPEQTPSGRKKKIIPVDFESSPSPEDAPSTPSSERKSAEIQDYGVVGNDGISDLSFHRMGSSNSFSHNSGRKLTSGSANGAVDDKALSSNEGNSKKKSSFLSSKWKTSISLGNLLKIGSSDQVAGNSLNLNQLHSGFREKDASNLGKRRDSSDSLEGKLRHQRNSSDGSSSIGSNVPSGPRVVLGRETTPTGPQTFPGNGDSSHKVPKEVWDRFEGKSREDLIALIVSLQSTVEVQAKKQTDLEEYIDSLLMKVLETAPDILQKNPANPSDLGERTSFSRSNLVLPLYKAFSIRK